MSIVEQSQWQKDIIIEKNEEFGMNKILIAILTLLFLAIEVIATYSISSAWIVLFAIVMMGITIYLGYKQVALAIVLSIFSYGGVLALMDKQVYVSKDIKIIGSKIIDKKEHKVFKLDLPLLENIQKNSGPKEVACQYYTLFGKKVADYFCYLKIGEDIYQLKEIK